MKKLLVLSVLLGLMALPMFASDFSWGGDATFGFIGDFGDAEAETDDTTFDVMATIDEYSSLTINTDDLDTALSWAGISKILVATDIGAWLDLPVGLVVSWGYDDPSSNNFQVLSGYENEDFFDFGPAEYWGLAILISYNIIEVELESEVKTPTVIFYPGRRSGQYGLHFLDFYPVDGNYRSTLLGGL